MGAEWKANSGAERLRYFAMQAIVDLVADMDSSPVPDAATITREQLGTLAEYVSHIKPEKLLGPLP